jgi:hypothetical protein
MQAFSTNWRISQLAVGPVESAFIHVELEQGQSASYIALARRSVKQLN